MPYARVVTIAACLGGGCFVSQPKIEILDDGGSQNESDAGADSGSTASPAATLASPQRSCEAGACWWSKTVGACMSAGVPQSRDRPDIENAANELPAIYLGFSEISLAGPLHGARDPNAWRSLGFDLDQSCTESPSCEMSDRGSCRTQRGSGGDGERCRDNALGRLYGMIHESDSTTSAPGWDESRINCELRRGGATFILRITGYSGEADDPQVRVDYYQSDGVALPTWRCDSGADKDRYPIWLSSNRFGIDASSLTSGIEREGTLPDAFLFDDSAYVRGGYLVTEFPQDSSLRLLGEASFSLSVARGTLAAQLARGQDGQWKLHDGVFGGRLRVEPLLRSIRESGVCESDARYAPLEDSIRTHLDVLASGERAPGRDCDALSFAIGFEASPLRPGAAHTIADPTECGGSEAERCGDGKVTGSETCDISIARDRARACPTSCPESDACLAQALTGEACHAHCVDQPVRAMNGDGCCPAGADARSDSDCSTRCGDGVVQFPETCDPCEPCASDNPCLPLQAFGNADQCNLHCEPAPVMACVSGDACCPATCTSGNDRDCSSACGNGRIDAGETCDSSADPPCPTTCDDHDPCTQDIATGSEANCNLLCNHFAIREANDSDGCCPSDASGTDDPDCKVGTSDAALCAMRSPWNPACTSCTCAKCADPALQCLAADADVRGRCAQAVSCAYANSCSGTTCYCGSSALCSSPNGPCKVAFESAAGSSDTLIVSNSSNDPASPLGRAQALMRCTASNCAAECGRD